MSARAALGTWSTSLSLVIRLSRKKKSQQQKNGGRFVCLTWWQNKKLARILFFFFSGVKGWRGWRHRRFGCARLNPSVKRRQTNKIRRQKKKGPAVGCVAPHLVQRSDSEHERVNVTTRLEKILRNFVRFSLLMIIVLNVYFFFFFSLLI